LLPPEVELDELEFELDEELELDEEPPEPPELEELEPADAPAEADAPLPPATALELEPLEAPELEELEPPLPPELALEPLPADAPAPAAAPPLPPLTAALEELELDELELELDEASTKAGLIVKRVTAAMPANKAFVFIRFLILSIMIYVNYFPHKFRQFVRRGLRGGCPIGHLLLDC
jgi:hypothetical protein